MFESEPFVDALPKQLAFSLIPKVWVMVAMKAMNNAMEKVVPTKALAILGSKCGSNVALRNSASDEAPGRTRNTGHEPSE